MTTPSPQPRNPLHGITLEAMLTSLVAAYGWAGLGERIALRCFTREPSIASSLKVLRKTPWAREKVEHLYLFMLREAKRSRLSGSSSARPKDRRVGEGSTGAF
jgi:uncharacterized protein (DUF2132 family)